MMNPLEVQEVNRMNLVISFHVYFTHCLNITYSTRHEPMLRTWSIFVSQLWTRVEEIVQK
jgi:hypothetical protein